MTEVNRIRQQLEQAQVDYSRACQNQRADWDEIRERERLILAKNRSNAI